jgi:hypothetical protein
LESGDGIMFLIHLHIYIYVINVIYAHVYTSTRCSNPYFYKKSLTGVIVKTAIIVG